MKWSFAGAKDVDIYSKFGIYKDVPREPKIADVFQAIAQPRRRQIIGLLNDGEAWAVNDLVARVKLAQPAVSKHLGALRKVGVVTVVKRGQQRLYRLQAEELKPVHDWVKAYERYWNRQISRIRERSEQKAMDRIARENRSIGSKN